MEDPRLPRVSGFHELESLITPYTVLPPAAGSEPRPLLDVAVGDVHDARVRCLLDSGAVHTLFPMWVASIAGVDLISADRRELAVGGGTLTARFTTCLLQAADHRWEAEVGFAHLPRLAWGLLGHHAFFRWFEVTFRGADLEFEITPAF